MLNNLFFDATTDKDFKNGGKITIKVKCSDVSFNYSYDGPRGRKDNDATEDCDISIGDLEFEGSCEASLSGLVKLATGINDTIKDKIRKKESAKAISKYPAAPGMETKYQSYVDNDTLVSEIDKNGVDCTVANKELRYVVLPVNDTNNGIIRNKNDNVIANIAIKSNESFSILKWGIYDFVTILYTTKSSDIPADVHDMLKGIMEFGERAYYTTMNSSHSDNDDFIITVLTIYNTYYI